MKQAMCVGGPGIRDESFRPATIAAVRPCPARSDYLELCFETDEGPWTWCFPEPTERHELADGVLALKLGTYAVQAHYVRNGELGLAMPTSEALGMILGGSRIYIARRLVARE